MKKQTASKKVTKEYLSINQKRQGILIETRNTSNPVLLIIHGGPGFPLYPFMSAHQVDLTHHYTVVYWDQPGTGMSGVDTEETIQALVDDAYQLIQHLRTKFNQSKVYLMCHSFGTIVGTHLAHQHPQYIATYIGIGQLGHVLKNEHRILNQIKMFVRQEGDHGGLQLLEKVHLDYDFHKNKYYQLLREWYTARYKVGFSSRGYGLFKMIQVILKTPHYSWLERLNILRSGLMGAPRLSKEMTRTNLLDIAQEIWVPMIIMQGVHDLQTTLEESRIFFEKIGSRYKRYYYFQDAAHAPFIDETEKFLFIMKEIVAPHAT